MRPGSVIVDVAIDQGGCVETIKATTHENPTYVVDGVIHYGVANMPGGVPRTSTLALTNATFPYALQLANKGWKRALADQPALLHGLNIVDGHVTYPGVRRGVRDASRGPEEVHSLTRRFSRVFVPKLSLDRLRGAGYLTARPARRWRGRRSLFFAAAAPRAACGR